MENKNGRQVPKEVVDTFLVLAKWRDEEAQKQAASQADESTLEPVKLAVLH
jgi:hypothetical protein